MSTPIKVMTFNMRINTPVDGDNWFCHRRPKIAEVIRRENPDIIGFQEIDEEIAIYVKAKETGVFITRDARNKLKEIRKSRRDDEIDI